MLPDDCQRLLFSGTVDDTVLKFTQRMIPNPHDVIKLSPGEEMVNNIKLSPAEEMVSNIHQL